MKLLFTLSSPWIFPSAAACYLILSVSKNKNYCFVIFDIQFSSFFCIIITSDKPWCSKKQLVAIPETGPNQSCGYFAQVLYKNKGISCNIGKSENWFRITPYLCVCSFEIIAKHIFITHTFLPEIQGKLCVQIAHTIKIEQNLHKIQAHVKAVFWDKT